MATLRDIRQRIKGIKSTSKITSAMKMVATAKLKRSQSAIENARPYFEGLENMLSNLVESLGNEYDHPLLRKVDEVKNIAIIVISADRGLCGSFNSNLLKYVMNHVNTEILQKYKNANVKVIPVGRKSVSFFAKQPFEIIQNFNNAFVNLDFSLAKHIVDGVREKFINGEIDKVIVFRNEFINVLKQEPREVELLPVESSKSTKTDINTKKVDFIFEPSIKAIVDDLLPKVVDVKVWRSLLESNAAEQAARRIAMDNATRNANDLINFLELQYNKARQAAITTEMLEIVGGAEALQG
ncbi:MAG TPA: ATP synthase F1 subunit gamma [Candidatus Kapabacteria bacterium]|nr:ATP synthase F1 subunit gamma [Candidatus Kapabacteria bacterium]